ncbi:SDR family oxidoreductase [Companilactobacillus versmoldensis]|uniref:Short-chain alcohol dehydrogenase n=1 Tax=Companilactobacillus versmoldensis DSM 14857 = KCTC 3814 TaxID=1423815 RepID=A0A0R1SAY5_9LACO|nr:SDR family oxidoreductase [Companilactobacillus versmoldensis]KRL66224.1 short-chain alcohol dehydrogenase [Companilactobacillus versmoldensis DSM 14857 = KCTC 3814]
MIKEKVVVITGASSGIGASTAMLLASKGAKLVLGARREDKLQRIVNKIKENGGEAIYKTTDVVNPDDNKSLVEAAKKEFGRVDVIFLNAGLMPSSEIAKLKTDEWDRTVDVNIKGVLNGIAAIMPTFKEQNGGQIVTTSSVAGLKPYPGVGVYGATKHAVRDLMEVLRMESAQTNSNIRTATIYPAAIHTELLSTITDPEAAKAMQANYDQYQIGPDRVANVVAFAIDQPEDTNVSEFTVGPTNQPW